jgi:hypothetical protein
MSTTTGCFVNRSKAFTQSALSPDSAIEQADGELCGPFRILVAFGENHSDLTKTFQFIEFEESGSLDLEAHGALCGFLLIHRFRLLRSIAHISRGFFFVALSQNSYIFVKIYGIVKSRIELI